VSHWRPKLAPHVAHHQVGAGVGVVEAAQAAGGEHVLELGGIEPEEGHRFGAAVAVAEVDAEILHELVVHHRAWELTVLSRKVCRPARDTLSTQGSPST
jgi:hypothetical protein